MQVPEISVHTPRHVSATVGLYQRRRQALLAARSSWLIHGCSLFIHSWHCNQPGHFRSDCPQLRGADARGAQTGARGGCRGNGCHGGRGGGVTCTFAVGATATAWSTDWVPDLGASHHVTGNSQVLLDARLCTDVSITFGNGHRHKATLIGDVIIELHFGHQLRLQGVLYVSGASANLFSICSAIQRGARFRCTELYCDITQHDNTLIAVAPCGTDYACTA